MLTNTQQENATYINISLIQFFATTNFLLRCLLYSRDRPSCIYTLYTEDAKSNEI